MSRFLVLAALLAWGTAANAPAQSPPEIVGPSIRYANVAERLTQFIEAERDQKQLPAVLLVLVDDQEIVWARGFGEASPGQPASAQTVGRVGSVSKLFTDLAAMQLVEQGLLDLDAPVSNYLPEFQPRTLHQGPVTLRQLMSHHSGLVREPPVGHYFDLNGPTLEETVKSLQGVELVHEPTTRTKYSNAGIAVVGRVVETLRSQPFANTVQETVLQRIGMRDSGFAPGPALRKATAKGVMWTVDGATFEAPTFALGMAPAGDLYATPVDLGKFLAMLFARGKGLQGNVLNSSLLQEMWKPQFVGPEAKNGFGLGFVVDEFAGAKRVGHSGAVYGFATDLQALPEEKLGVAVIVTRDCANGIARRIAEESLRLMRAANQGTLGKTPDPVKTTTPDPALAKRVAGRYGAETDFVELLERNGRLFLVVPRQGISIEVRAREDRLQIDDPIVGFGSPLELTQAGLKIGAKELPRIPPSAPRPLPEHWRGLIGEYGWDHNTLYILEKDGQLHALIEWFFLYPLIEVGPDVYRFPDYGMYDNQNLVFERDAHGKAKSVRAAEVRFPRRSLDGEDGRTFRIQPVSDIEQTRAQALKAIPPVETGNFRAPELRDLAALDSTIKLDIRYATPNNFLGVSVYPSARAFLQAPAAAALLKAHQALTKEGYGLWIHDAYRPWSITKLFRLVTPKEFHSFVADPDKGSRHNRGCAVDLTLYDRSTGLPVEMPGGYDEFSPRSRPDYPGGTTQQRRLRNMLRQAMEAEGFTVNEVEWWHFDFKDWAQYPILNKSFDGL